MASSKEPYERSDKPLVVGMSAIAVAIAVILIALSVDFLSTPSTESATSDLLGPAPERTVGDEARPVLAPRPLQGEPVLAGRVVDSSGAGINDVVITVTAELAAPYPRGQAPAKDALVIGGSAIATVTADGGLFALDSLPPGLYRIQIEGSSVITAEVRYIEVPETELSITALRQVTISGRVVADEKAPSALAASITVVARGELGEEQTLAAADGTFTLSPLPEGVYHLWAEATSLASPALFLEARGEPSFDDVELVIAPASRVSGMLRDSETGAPLPGEVVMTSDSGEPERRIASSTGSYVAIALPPGRWTAQASADGYVPSEQLTFEADRDRQLDLQLSRGGRVIGTVVDSEGRPVEGAILSASVDQKIAPRPVSKPVSTAWAATAPGTRFIPRGELGVLVGPIPFPPTMPSAASRIAQPIAKPSANAASAPNAPGTASGTSPAGDQLSDASGQFVLAGLSTGTYWISATHPDFVGAAPVAVKVTLGETTDRVNVIMRGGMRLRGVVREQGGSPIAGAIVVAKIANTNPVRVITAPDGSFALPPVVGAVTIEASASGFATQRQVIAVAKDGTERTLEIELERADKVLTGRLSDSAGNPVRGARVVLTTEVSGDTTDEHGRFEITGVARGSHEIRVEHSDFPPLTTKGVADQAVDISLPIGGGLGGEVRDKRTGSSIALASLEMRRGERAVTTKSTEAGNFKMKPLASGRWKLTVVASGYARSVSEVEIPAGNRPGLITVREFRVELERGARIGGVVRDENGERVKGAVVEVAGLKTTTDIDGRFRIRDVPGRGDMVIEVSSETRSGEERLVLDPGDDRSTLDIRITPN